MRPIGTIRREALALTCAVVREWGVREIGVGYSGLFTIERAVGADGIRAHSCDVAMISAVMGTHYATGDALPLRLREPYREQYQWLEPYLETSAGRVAVAILGDGLFHRWGRQARYYERVRSGVERDWERLYRKTVDWVKGASVPLIDYTSGDAFEWVQKYPIEGAVVSYPPFAHGGSYHETFWARYRVLESVFEWKPPPFQCLEGERLHAYFRALAERRYWLFWHDERLRAFQDALIAVVKPTPRAPTIYLYGTGRRRSYCAPAVQSCEELPSIWRPEYGIDTMQVRVIPEGVFVAMRERFLSRKIQGARATWYFGVFVNDRFFGGFAYAPMKAFGYNDPRANESCLYLLSDFCVHRGGYLSKLVLYAALSGDVRRYCEARLRKRLYGVVTTAFSEHPESMKYRGLFECISRKSGEESVYELNYYAPFGDWSVEEGFEKWKMWYASRWSEKDSKSKSSRSSSDA